MMPTRMVREGLLDSDRYWAVTIEARQLFWHLMLLADDFGCVSLAPAFIRRRCFDDGPSQEKIDRLITQLMDVDLIRVYESNGARYAFIPRFQQRLKRFTLKHPEPAAAVLSGDDDAKAKFKKIRDDADNPAAGQRPDGCPPAPEVEVEGKKNLKQGAAAPASDLWTEGLTVLTSANVSIEAGRSFIGKCLKTWPAETVRDSLLESAGTAEPKAYAWKLLQSKPRKSLVADPFVGAR
jgi:hypothetical protein